MACQIGLRERLQILTILFMDSLVDVLHHFGYDPEGILSVRNEIALQESGIRYVLKIDGGRRSAYYQIDGNVITVGARCDKMILVEEGNQWDQLFIELKGKDVLHAISQLETTIANPLLSHDSICNKYARIVAKAFPANRANPNVERARDRFRKKYNCRLKTLKSNQLDKI